MNNDKPFSSTATVPTSVTMRDERVIHWQGVVGMWAAREAIARKRLSFHEDRDHTLGVDERRNMVRLINVAQDERERAEYMLRRAEAGLPV